MRKMKKVIIPLKTYHNVRGPVSRIVGNEAEMITLVNRAFVDITSDDWKEEIKKKLQSIKSANSSSLFFVATGHPAVNIFVFNEAKKLFGEVKMLFWNSAKKKYHIIRFD